MEETTAEKDGRDLGFAAAEPAAGAGAVASDAAALLLDPGRVPDDPAGTSGTLKLKVAEGTRKDWPAWWWKCC